MAWYDKPNKKVDKKFATNQQLSDTLRDRGVIVRTAPSGSGADILRERTVPARTRSTSTPARTTSQRATSQRTTGRRSTDNVISAVPTRPIQDGETYYTPTNQALVNELFQKGVDLNNLRRGNYQPVFPQEVYRPTAQAATQGAQPITNPAAPARRAVTQSELQRFPMSVGQTVGADVLRGAYEQTPPGQQVNQVAPTPRLQSPIPPSRFPMAVGQTVGADVLRGPYNAPAPTNNPFGELRANSLRPAVTLYDTQSVDTTNLGIDRVNTGASAFTGQQQQSDTNPSALPDQPYGPRPYTRDQFVGDNVTKLWQSTWERIQKDWGDTANAGRMDFFPVNQYQQELQQQAAPDRANNDKIVQRAFVLRQAAFANTPKDYYGMPRVPGDMPLQPFVETAQTEMGMEINNDLPGPVANAFALGQGVMGNVGQVPMLGPWSNVFGNTLGTLGEGIGAVTRMPMQLAIPVGVERVPTAEILRSDPSERETDYAYITVGQRLGVLTDVLLNPSEWLSPAWGNGQNPITTFDNARVARETDLIDNVYAIGPAVGELYSDDPATLEARDRRSTANVLLDFSGSNAALEYVELSGNRNEKVAALREIARSAYAASQNMNYTPEEQANYALTAAQLELQIKHIEGASEQELADMFLLPVRDAVLATVTDLTLLKDVYHWVSNRGKGIAETGTAWNPNRRRFMSSLELAQKADDEVATIAREIAESEPAVRTAAQRLLEGGLSVVNHEQKQTKAALATLFSAVTNREDIPTILRAIGNDLELAVTRGIPVSELHSTELWALAENGYVRIPEADALLLQESAGAIVANINKYADQWQNLLSLKNPKATINAVMDEVLRATELASAERNGVLKLTNAPPLGTNELRLATKSNAAGDLIHVIEYVDADGKVLHRSPWGSLPMAEREIAVYNAAVKAGEFLQVNYLDAFSDFARRSVSVPLIYTRPGSWVRNALGAWLTGISTATNTMIPVDDVLAFVEQQYPAGTPYEYLQRGTTSKMFDARLPGKNPISQFMNWASSVRGGHTEIAGTNVSFGENAFKAKTWYKGAQDLSRTSVDTLWRSSIEPALVQMNVPDSTRRFIEGNMRQLAKTWDINKFVDQVTNFAQGRLKHVDIAAAGRHYAEVLPAAAKSLIDDLAMKVATPEELTIGIQNIVDKEIERLSTTAGYESAYATLPVNLDAELADALKHVSDAGQRVLAQGGDTAALVTTQQQLKAIQEGISRIYMLASKARNSESVKIIAAYYRDISVARRDVYMVLDDLSRQLKASPGNEVLKAEYDTLRLRYWAEWGDYATNRGQETIVELMGLDAGRSGFDVGAVDAAREADLMAAPAPTITGYVPDTTLPEITPAELAAEYKSGALETRAQIRAEWDRVAKANGLGNRIDQVVATYTRGGIVNVPENAFEDLYGATIAGIPINNQSDVDRLLQQYYDLGQQKLQMSIFEDPAIYDTGPLPAAADNVPAAPAADPLGEVGQAVNAMRSGISDGLRAAYTDSVTRTGKLPSAEVQSNSLLNQVYERLVQQGAPRDTNTLATAIELNRQAGGEAARMGQVFADYRAGQQAPAAGAPSLPDAAGRAVMRDSIDSTGRLPQSEIDGNSLLNQVYEKLVADGAPRAGDTFDTAYDLATEAKNDPATMSQVYADYQRVMAPATAPQAAATVQPTTADYGRVARNSLERWEPDPDPIIPADRSLVPMIVEQKSPGVFVPTANQMTGKLMDGEYIPSIVVQDGDGIYRQIELMVDQDVLAENAKLLAQAADELTKREYYRISVDAVQGIENTQGYPDQLIDDLAQALVASNGTAAMPVIVEQTGRNADTFEPTYTLVSNELVALAAQRAKQINPRAGEYINAFVVEGATDNLKGSMDELYTAIMPAYTERPTAATVQPVAPAVFTAPTAPTAPTATANAAPTLPVPASAAPQRAPFNPQPAPTQPAPNGPTPQLFTSDQATYAEWQDLTGVDFSKFKGNIFGENKTAAIDSFRQVKEMHWQAFYNAAEESGDTRAMEIMIQTQQDISRLTAETKAKLVPLREKLAEAAAKPGAMDKGSKAYVARRKAAVAYYTQQANLEYDLAVTTSAKIQAATAYVQAFPEPVTFRHPVYGDVTIVALRDDKAAVRINGGRTVTIKASELDADTLAAVTAWQERVKNLPNSVDKVKIAGMNAALDGEIKAQAKGYLDDLITSRERVGIAEAGVTSSTADSILLLQGLREKAPQVAKTAFETTAGQLDPRQLNAVLDSTNTVRKQWGRIKTAAAKHGDNMASWHMIDFTRRYRPDQIAALLFPYHTFTTRTGRNLAERILTQAGVRHALDIEGAFFEEQNGDPAKQYIDVEVGGQRLRFYTSISGYTMGMYNWNQDATYQQQQQIDGPLGPIYATEKNLGTGAYPFIDFADAGIRDPYWDEHKGDYTVGGIAGVAGRAFGQSFMQMPWSQTLQAVTQMVASQVGVGNIPSWMMGQRLVDDVSRRLAAKVQNGEITEVQALYAGAILDSSVNGRPLPPQMSAEQIAAAEKLLSGTVWEQGVNTLATRLSSDLLGVTAVNLTPGRQGLPPVPTYQVAKPGDVAQLQDGQYSAYNTRLTTMTNAGMISTADADALRAWLTGARQGKPGNLPAALQPVLAQLNLSLTTQANAQRRTEMQTGVPMYSDPSQLGLSDAQSLYAATAYPKNELGGRTAQAGVRALNPGITTYWMRYNIKEPDKNESPGVTARRTEYFAAADLIYSERAKEVTDYILANSGRYVPNAEISAIDDTYQERISALKKKYGDVLAGTAFEKSTRGMNPHERAVHELVAILEYDGEKPPYPTDDMTPEQRVDAFAAREKWDNARLDYIERTLEQFATEPNQEAWRQTLRQYVQGEYASELVRKYINLKYAGRVEKQWDAFASVEREMLAAGYAGNEQNVIERLGAATLRKWQIYQAQDDNLTGEAGAQAKRKYADSNPEIAAARIAMYNPEAYDAGVSLFGQQMWTTYAAYKNQKPEYPGENADEKELAAYYDKLNALDARFPQAAEIQFWVEGRYRWWEAYGAEQVRSSDPNQNAEGSYGGDYAAAQQLFGPDIFETWLNIPHSSKKATAQYYDAHPELEAFNAWRRQYSELPDSPEQLQQLDVNVLEQAARDAGQLQQPVPASFMTQYGMYAGPRPVGSDRQPIDETLAQRQQRLVLEAAYQQYAAQQAQQQQIMAQGGQAAVSDPQYTIDPYTGGGRGSYASRRRYYSNGRRGYGGRRYYSGGGGGGGYYDGGSNYGGNGGGGNASLDNVAIRRTYPDPVELQGMNPILWESLLRRFFKPGA